MTDSSKKVCLIKFDSWTNQQTCTISKNLLRSKNKGSNLEDITTPYMDEKDTASCFSIKKQSNPVYGEVTVIIRTSQDCITFV